MRFRKCGTLVLGAMRMRLLAFLLIITEIFILFSTANGYQDNHKATNYSPPYIVHTNKQQDNISPLELSQKLAQVIRVSGLDITPTAEPATTTKTTTKQQKSRVLHEETHQEETVSYSWPYPSSSEEGKEAAAVVTKNKAEELDRYHHSSKLVDVNALFGDPVEGGRAVGSHPAPATAAVFVESESNPLIEQRTRSKRELDNEETALVSVAIASAEASLRPEQLSDTDDNGSDLKSNSNKPGESHTNEVQDNGPASSSSRAYRVDQAKHHSGLHHHGHQKIKPHFSIENHEGPGRARFRNKNGYCHEDCADSRRAAAASADRQESNGAGAGNNGTNSQKVDQSPASASYKICGSNGRFYGSVCELKRHSCRQNIHLSRKPRAYCSRRRARQEQQQQQQQQHGSTVEADSASLPMNPPRDGNEEVRIVELKRLCNSLAYNEMKLLLVREFNGDLGSMFKYFDTNGDNFVEAHELWPRQEDNSNKLRYAQVWDEHSNKCRHHERQSRGGRYARYSQHLDDPTKCWYFLDFAFEPQFASNPCSLSHLMLFDLKHPSNRFTPESFREAFAEHSVSNVNSASNYQNVSDTSSGQEEEVTRVRALLGDSISLSCLNSFIGKEDKVGNANMILDGLEESLRCFWTRYDLNLGAIQDPHIHIGKQRIVGGAKGYNDLRLHLRDAQLYLSGHYKCACHSKKFERTFEHSYSVQILAKPRVDIRPKFQWSLPASRISFECHYDHIDTSVERDRNKIKKGQEGAEPGSADKSKPTTTTTTATDVSEQLNENGQFGLRVKWLKDDRKLVVDSKKFNGLSQSQLQSLATNDDDAAAIVSSRNIGVRHDEDSFYSAIDNGTSYSGNARHASSGFGDDNDDDDGDGDDYGQDRYHELNTTQLAETSSTLRPTMMSESSRRASITMAASRLTLENLTTSDSGQHTCRVDVPNYFNEQFTIVQDRLNDDSRKDSTAKQDSMPTETYGESVGTLLVQEQPKSDQSSANELYGTNLWMFHDNGISIYRLQNDDGQEMELVREINGHSMVSGEVDGNWNQLTLCGGLNPEQVVICEWSDNALHIDVRRGLNFKPQRYIYVGQPNLNRIIVIDGLKFEIVAIINTEPQPRKLFKYKPNKIHLSKWVRRRLSPAANARWLDSIGTHAHPLKSTPDSKLYSMTTASSFETSTQFGTQNGHKRAAIRERRLAATNHRLTPLTQHDIWLLCYGQPLVVDPSGDEHLEGPNRFYSAFSGENTLKASNITSTSHKKSQRLNVNPVQPFTPRLNTRAPFGWPVWPNKESKLRNRKSVHIVQSTFFPPSTLSHDSSHNHDEVSEEEESASRTSRNETVVGEFKRSTVLTTHHIFSGIPTISAKPQLYLARPRFDLIQDLYVPPKPYSLELDETHKIHHAYVTHYDDRKIFRVSMDDYQYDREIDLRNCDPINLVNTAQGLLVIQCRAQITHNLVGQLVLDQLTTSKIEFNANIKAQESCLSPDHRYLVSIFNEPASSASVTTELDTKSSADSGVNQKARRSMAQKETNESKRQSIIYVQTITVAGLKLQYEIKTTLEISQCSFVWKDGYYAAIFVSTNHRDDQSEILSLRLADGRLQLMARVPGLVNTARHKDQMIMSPELRLAALSTSQGTYVVDLEDNRVSQSLRHHQSPPTMLWV